MTKLSLNKAATYAGKAKADILKALKSNDPSKKLSGEKNGKGHWEIEESELDRFFGKKNATPVYTGSENGSNTPNKGSENNPLEVEVAVLREQLRSAESDKGHLLEKIEDLRTRAERAEAKEDSIRALLTSLTPPKPEAEPEPQKRGLWARLTG